MEHSAENVRSGAYVLSQFANLALPAQLLVPDLLVVIPMVDPLIILPDIFVLL